LRVSIFETLGIFVGIPLLIYGTIALLTVVRSRAKARPRYRPGQSWDYAPAFWAGNEPVVVPPTGVLGGTSRGGARGTW
jgi:hypothetical protein